MKIIKQAKVVNLCLNSPKKLSPTIHLTQNTSQEHQKQQNFHHDQLLHNCYEAVKIISQQKTQNILS